MWGGPCPNHQLLKGTQVAFDGFYQRYGYFFKKCSILSHASRRQCKVWYGFIVPMYCNKLNITCLCCFSVFRSTIYLQYAGWQPMDWKCLDFQTIQIKHNVNALSRRRLRYQQSKITLVHFNPPEGPYFRNYKTKYNQAHMNKTEKTPLSFISMCLVRCTPTLTVLAHL